MIKFTRHTLDNGLRIVHNYDPSTAMVAVNVLYDVGSRDESASMTGLAHLFEHLMFGGSENIPDFDAAIENAGGTDNAWTSADFTNFYDVAPASNAETLFWLESDRMLSLSFSPRALQVQKGVVIEEFKETHLNRPYGDMGHLLRDLLYRTHPYRWPTIGLEVSHIEKVSIDDIKDFYFSHYAPNNAVLAVSGNITADEAMRLARKWMGPIPRREIAPRLWHPEAPITEPRRRVVHARVPQAMIVVAFPMPAYGKPGYLECDILTDILAAGRASRFFRRLVMGTDIFTDADASISGNEEEGFLMLTGRLASADDETVASAEKMLLDEAMQLAGEGNILPAELERANNRYESDFTFSSMSYLAKAQALAMAEMHGEDVNDIIEQRRAVTLEGLRATAARVINPVSSVTIHYLPQL